jgi:hypothetical protein
VLKVILQYRSVEILPPTPYKEVKQAPTFFFIYLPIKLATHKQLCWPENQVLNFEVIKVIKDKG